MSINEVRYLPECGSTNAYVKEHFEEFGPVGAVYTENQTAGRGRLGRSWVNAEGKALYYTAAIREPLAQPATLPLLASLAVRTQLKLRYGVDCQIKWPNDLLLNGKKIVGILCEGVSYGYQQQGRGILCGIGINLAQPQSYFDAAGLPNGTSPLFQSTGIPRPKSSTMTLPSLQRVTLMVSPWPSRASSMELETISKMEWAQPSTPSEPKITAGRLRTRSAPFKEVMLSLPYSCFFAMLLLPARPFLQKAGRL